MYFINAKDSYPKKSISGYDRDKIFKILERMLLKDNYSKSIYFMNEIVASGYIQELWNFLFNFYIKYIHAINIELLKEMILSYSDFLLTVKKVKMEKRKVIDLRENKKMIYSLIKILKNIINNRKKDLYTIIPPSLIPENNQNTGLPNIDFRNMKQKDIITLIKHFDTGNEDNIKVNIQQFIFALQLYPKNKRDNLSKIYYWFQKIIFEDFKILDVGIDHLIMEDKKFVESYTNITKKYTQIIWEYLLNVSRSYDERIYQKMVILFNLYTKKICNTREVLTVALLNIINPIYTNNQIINCEKKDLIMYFILYKNIDESLRFTRQRKDHINFFNNAEEKKKYEISQDPELMKEEMTKMIKKTLIPNIKKKIKMNPKPVTTEKKPKSPDKKITPKKKTPKKTKKQLKEEKREKDQETIDNKLKILEALEESDYDEGDIVCPINELEIENNQDTDEIIKKIVVME